jgi:hypothetical protein
VNDSVPMMGNIYRPLVVWELEDIVLMGVVPGLMMLLGTLGVEC